jgi:nitroreductase
MNNKFLDAMMFRHATKKFDTTKPVSDEEFADILQMGRLSPSSFGFEPWKFVVLQNRELREKLKEFTWGAQDMLPTATHFVIILARKKKGMIYGSEYINHMLNDVKKLPSHIQEIYNELYEKFQKVDFDILKDDRTIFDWSCKQTYIALANMMSGAAYMGIDSCAVEGFDVHKMEEFLANELKIDTEEFGTSVMVAFGHRESEPREKSRQSIEDITAWYN